MKSSKQKSAPGTTPLETASRLGLDPGQLRDILDSLLAAGLIYDTGRKRDGQPVYKTTQMGKLLAEYPPAKEQH